MSSQGGVVEDAKAADRRRRQDRPAFGLVVETDVARHHGEVQRLAGSGHATDRRGKLPHDLGLLRVAEIQVVGDRQRVRANRRQVPPGFGHGLGAADLWVGEAVSGCAIDGQSQSPLQALKLHHRCVGGTGALHRLPADGAVVLVPHPGARAQIRATDEDFQRAGQAEAILDPGRVKLF
jgi:hypothetical protein